MIRETQHLGKGLLIEYSVFLMSVKNIIVRKQRKTMIEDYEQQDM